MTWKVKTKYGTVYAETKDQLPPLDEDFVKDYEYTEVDESSISSGLNERLVQEMLTFVQSFQGEIHDNEVSVKKLETVSESLITGMKQSMETQLFVLRNQKTEINRSDRGRIEKRREVDEIQEQIDGIEDQLENLERVREEVLE